MRVSYLVAKKDAFIPFEIIIKLESEEDAEKLYAIMNYDTIARYLGTFTFDIRDILRNYTGVYFDAEFCRFRDLMEGHHAK